MPIPFGYRQDLDEHVDIDEAANSLACDCIYTSCGMRLEAKIK